MSVSRFKVCLCLRLERTRRDKWDEGMNWRWLSKHLSFPSQFLPFFLSFNLPMLICDEVAPEWTSSLLKTDEGGAAESQARKSIKDNNEGKNTLKGWELLGIIGGSSDESRKRMCSNCEATTQLLQQFRSWASINIHNTTYIRLKQNKNYWHFYG